MPRILLFLPYAVPGVVAALMWGYIYGDKYGLVGQIFHMMGVQAPNMLSEQLMLFAIANICTWCFLGYNMLIYYSALIGIPNDLSELVADLAAENQNIIGIKDTVDTISHTRKVIAARSARHGCAGTCSTSICSTRMHRTCPAFGRSCGTPRDSAWISYRRRNMDWPRPLQHHRRTVSW